MSAQNVKMTDLNEYLNTNINLVCPLSRHYMDF